MITTSNARMISAARIPEERFLATQNAYDPEIIREFHAELRDR